MTKSYCGIGSRTTPPDVLHLMTAVATRLAMDGWTLRSGHADGADLAFEVGAKDQCEIYLPWTAFNSHFPIAGRKLASPTQAAMHMAKDFHPAWNACSNGSKLLHARNVHQILGRDLNDPVRFVICWTPDGQASGGTGQAMRLAQARGIDVFNLHDPEHRTRLEKYVSPQNGIAA